MRTIYFWSYAACSIAIAIGTLDYINTYLPNTYAIGVAINEGVPLLVFANLIIVVILGCGKILQRIAFGELRLIEIEHIYERAWPTIMGMGMSAAIYSQQESPLFLILIILGLLVTKIFHWIIIDRLDMLIQQYHLRPNSKIKNVILNNSIFVALLLFKIDFSIVKLCIDESSNNKQAILLVLAFEFFLILMELVRATVKFSIQVMELIYISKYPEEEVWDFKAWLLSITDVFLSLVNALMVPTMFCFFITLGIVPLNLASDIFFAFLGLVRSTSALLTIYRSRKELNSAVSEPSLEDIERDDICIICRDEMVVGGIPGIQRSVPKKISCGHVLHLGCLKSWLERTNGCPVCRKPVIQENPKKINTNANEAQEPAPVPQNDEQGPQNNVPMQQNDFPFRQDGFPLRQDDLEGANSGETIAFGESSIVEAIPEQQTVQTNFDNGSSNDRALETRIHNLLNELKGVKLPETLVSDVNELNEHINRNNKNLNRNNNYTNRKSNLLNRSNEDSNRNNDHFQRSNECVNRNNEIHINYNQNIGTNIQNLGRNNEHLSEIEKCLKINNEQLDRNNERFDRNDEHLNRNIEQINEDRNNDNVERNLGTANTAGSARLWGSIRDWKRVRRYQVDDSDYLDYNDNTQLRFDKLDIT